MIARKGATAQVALAWLLAQHSWIVPIAATPKVYSRAGENYYGGRRNLEFGNIEVVAGMIRQLLACDVYRIEAADPYSDDYDATVECNVRELNDNARPGIANPRTSISDDDTVLVGSPI
ncbi:MAG TPA: hypothetical protein VK499_01200 [Propionibacteriaceae bacterium]|nr:hypothetical protein [Propionibacteriaceae bacterium]